MQISVTAEFVIYSPIHRVSLVLYQDAEIFRQKCL